MQQHKVHTTQFDTTKSCDDALKQQILEVLYNDYAEEASNTDVGFVQNTKLKLLNHLYDSYGAITPRKMDDATNSMATPYDTSKPTTNVFVQMEKGVQILNTENSPFTNAQTIAKAYLLILKIDYTVKNARLEITVQHQETSDLTSVYTYLKHQKDVRNP